MYELQKGAVSEEKKNTCFQRPHLTLFVLKSLPLLVSDWQATGTALLSCCLQRDKYAFRLLQCLTRMHLKKYRLGSRT